MAEGFVYILRSDDEALKVGRSVSPAQRAGAISYELGAPVEMLWVSRHLAHHAEVEEMAHWVLRDHHEGGEWFSVDLDTAIGAVNDAIFKVNAGHRAPQRINNATPFADLKDVRIQLVIGQSEIDALDEWRAQHKIWSRSDAIRRLIAEGVKAKAPKK